MKTRYLVEVYKVKEVKEYSEGGLSDIVEQTEDQNGPENFQYQIQGDSLEEVIKKLEESSKWSK